MNPMTPPIAPTADDLAQIGPLPSQPTVDGSGPMDTINLLFLANNGDPNTRRLAQEIVAYRWANCQANP